MTNEEKQIDIITELLIDFDEMGFAPTTTVPNPEAYAIEWRNKITEELKCYRKASEVARDVIDEIQSKIQIMVSSIKAQEEIGNISEFNGGAKTTLEIVFKDLTELKKKYESEGEK